MPSYDFIVLGSGPAGQRAAVQAAKVGARVAVVSATRLGGVCINTGTIPSKTLREVILELSDARPRHLLGLGGRSQAVTSADLLSRTRSVIQVERDVIRSQLERNGIDVYHGKGTFLGPHEISVEGDEKSGVLAGEKILIATGTVPMVPPQLPVDHRTVLTSDDILGLPELPRRLVIAGAGIIGVEYASMFAALGIPVELCDNRRMFLDMVDSEIRSLFQEQLESAGVCFHLGEKIVELRSGKNHAHEVLMESGKQLVGDIVLVSAGRKGNSAELCLERVGLSADDRGRIEVGPGYQTKVPHIYAAGDVIGPPQLASTSAEQGRLAACHAFGLPVDEVRALFPFGIYAIPEISWVGKTEEELRAAEVPYEAGIARYKEIARGNILGDLYGMLKLLVHRETLEILGVWICGAQASELVHIGQAVMALGGTLDYFIRTVFNYPTLAECYKVAALNGMNKIRARCRA
jgi:NAD(P) transhydrogenase